MSYSCWEYQDIIYTFASLICDKGGISCPLCWVYKKCVKPQCILYKISVLVTTKQILFSPQALIQQVLRLIHYSDPMMNLIAINGTILVLTGAIFHLNKVSSVLVVGIGAYAAKSSSSNPTSLFLSLSVNHSVKREESMFCSAQQNESSQGKEHLSALMNCIFFLTFWLHLASEPWAGESCLNELSSSHNL